MRRLMRAWARRTGGCLAALLFALCVLPAAPALAELNWPKPSSSGQEAAQAYIERVNTQLTIQKARKINSLFECYPSFANLGITESDNAETPEQTELILTMASGSLDKLELHTADLEAFPVLAAACIQAAAGDSLTMQEALKDPAAYLKRVKADSTDSFADNVMEEKGDTLRAYYAYAPNPYHDGVPWITLTLIFPRESGTATLSVTPVPDTQEVTRRISNDDGDPDWVGYYQPLGEEPHLEIFTTPTPEPDSAVYGY